MAIQPAPQRSGPAGSKRSTTTASKRISGARPGKYGQPVRSGPQRSRRTTVLVALAVLAVLAVLFGIFNNASNKSGPGGTTAKGSYDVGSPGIGKTAPGFTLQSATGGTVSLADYRGKSVLLYFQEGLMCQPCWDQITELEKSSAEVKAAGIDKIVSITSDPANLLAQKVKDQGISSTPVLSDPDLAVSRQYSTNKFGMMGESRNGHSFLLVGPDGKIQWRADYGGPPDYTMNLPVKRVLADMNSAKATTKQ